MDTVALAAAGRAAVQRSREVLDVAGTSGVATNRLAGDLAGAQCAAEAAGLGQAVHGVLGELGGALDRLGRLLSAAAGQYAGAEDWAVQSMAAAPAP